MCLACTALQYHVPRPEIMMPQTAPRLVVHYFGEIIVFRQIRMNTFGTSRKWKEHSFTFMMPLRMDLFHSDVRFFCNVPITTNSGDTFGLLPDCVLTPCRALQM